MTVRFKQDFSSNSDHIFFFAQSVLQEKYFRDQISIAMKSVAENFTARMFNDLSLALSA